MPEHGITIDCVWRNWLGGTIDGLPFAAKICDVNSPDSIDNGGFSKLNVTQQIMRNFTAKSRYIRCFRKIGF